MTGLVTRAVSDVVAGFGESAVWDPCRGGFWWLDMEAPRVFLTDPMTGRTRSVDLPSQAYAVAPDGETLILAERDALVGFDPDSGGRRRLATVHLPQGVRLNDGRMMPDGAFVFGSLDLEGGPRSRRAALFRYDGNEMIRLASGFSAINGVAWSARLGLVFADTRRGRLYRFEGSRPVPCGPAAWPDGFRPDGAAFDANGAYWSAQYGLGEVWRWMPGTDQVDRFPVDAASVTSCAFSPVGVLALTTGLAGSPGGYRLSLLDSLL